MRHVLLTNITFACMWNKIQYQKLYQLKDLLMFFFNSFVFVISHDLRSGSYLQTFYSRVANKFSLIKNTIFCYQKIDNYISTTFNFSSVDSCQADYHSEPIIDVKKQTALNLTKIFGGLNFLILILVMKTRLRDVEPLLVQVTTTEQSSESFSTHTQWTSERFFAITNDWLF